MRLALVDIDGTLVRGASTERRFAWWLARRGLLGPRQALAFVYTALRTLPRDGIHTLRKNKAYLYGLSSDRIARLGEQFVEQQIRAALFPPMVGRLKAHLAANDRVVLVSGTLQFIARPLAALLGATAVATVCEEADGRLAGGAPLLHPFGPAKAAIARQLCDESGIGLAETVAYGDSLYDLPLLDIVGTAVAVRPDRRLRRIAEQRGWEILSDSSVEQRLRNMLAQTRWRR